MHLYFSSLYFIVIRENRMSSKFVACIGKGGQRDMAESFARRTGTTLLDKPGEELTVLFDAKGVSLIGYGLSYQGDFEGMLHRVSDGRLAHEMLVRAAKTTQTNVKGIDATAGMGEDAFLLAACCGSSVKRCAPQSKETPKVERYCCQNAACGGQQYRRVKKPCG